MTSTTHTPDVHAATEAHQHHGLRLFPFFLALLALTAAEVGLYEWWRHSWHMEGDVKVFAIPKFALVLLILVFTLPKAYIVLVYFMHLRFEKAIVVWLAVVPLMMTFLAVLPTLTDSSTLKARKLHRATVIGEKNYGHKEDHKGHKHAPGTPGEQDHKEGAAHTDGGKAKPKTEPEDDYK